MGLKEHVKAGARLSRETVNITDFTGTGTVQLGATYGILSVEVNQPCRFRIYDNQASRDDTIETNRPFTSTTNVSSSIALVGDFSMSLNTSYTIDPMLFGHPHDGQNTYYRVEPSGVSIRINRYLLENASVQPSPQSPYNVNNRRTITITPSASLSPLQIYGDDFDNISVPKTYLLVSASLANASSARLRIYSRQEALDDVTEKNRPFSTEPNENMHLIADMLMTGSNPFYFTPKIVGANLSTIGSNLSSLVDSQNDLLGQSKMYYYLQNTSSGSTQQPSVNLYMYSLQD